jgi:hypothetical protein
MGLENCKGFYIMIIHFITIIVGSSTNLGIFNWMDKVSVLGGRHAERI